MEASRAGSAPMSEHCETVRFQLGALIDRELPEGGASEVERHLGACEPCRRFRGRIERLEALARDSARAPAVRPEDWARRFEAITVGLRVLALPVAGPVVRALGSAAAVLLVAAVAFPLLAPRPHPQAADRPAERELAVRPLPFRDAPGANEVEVLELGVDGYAATITLPEGDESPDAGVIVLSKL